MNDTRALAPGAVIGGRYIIRAVEVRKDDCLRYRAQDRAGTSWTIAEYYPADLAARTAEFALAPANDAAARPYQEGRRQFLARAGALAQVRHAGLEAFQSPIEERNTAYAIATAIDAPTLGAWVRSLGRAPSQPELDALLRPLLDALAALHGAGLSHWAIDPDVIVLTDNRHPVLTQPWMGRLPRVDSDAAAYAAPELLDGPVADIGPRSDFYALAATFYTLLTGTPPARSAARAGEVWLPPAIPVTGADYRPEFLQAIAMSLAPAPRRRPPNAAALKSLLLDDAIPDSTTEKEEQRSRKEVASPPPEPAEPPMPPEPPPKEPVVIPTPRTRTRQLMPHTRVPWFAIVLLAGGIVASFGYLGMRPTLPPSKPQAQSTPAARLPTPEARNTPVTPPPKAEAQTTPAARRSTPEARNTPVAPPPKAEAQSSPIAPATAPETIQPAAPSPRDEKQQRADLTPDIQQRIAEAHDRDELQVLAEAEPAHRGEIEARLKALGYLRLVNRTGVVWLRPGRDESFRDCPDCPEMVALPAGAFRMGSPPGEPGRQEDEDDTPGPGGNPVAVTIAQPFAIGKFEITRGEFAAFLKASGYGMEPGCYARDGQRELRSDLSWTTPGYQQDDRHPVTCVSWRDAVAYVQWLSTTTGASYRLLTEAEWEYAARAGSGTRYSFGDDERDICNYGNGADLAAREANPGWVVAPCNDGYRFTAPVGSFAPNYFGLYDMQGNLWEWVQDCSTDSLRHSSASSGGDAAGSLSCSSDTPRVLRGGSWSDPPARLRAAARIAGPPDARDSLVGFRVLRELGPKVTNNSAR